MSDDIPNKSTTPELDPDEVHDWTDSLDAVFAAGGPEHVRELMRRLQVHTHGLGVELPFTANTPYINTIHARNQTPFPGDRDLEWRISSIIRWNAMAMVVRANRLVDGIGGHISTYASAATLYETAFNHFFKGKDHPDGGDLIYFQGHSTPGIYARAFLEGRLSQEQLEKFRQEAFNHGLSSYPHPRLMPDFWEFPTVSMGLGPLMAIYQARFNRYLHDRGLKDTSKQKVWAFLGDGETDEPESLGAITLASREKLDNLIFVINCNLQRLDGPVRGNGKIIQELEAIFRGAGWNVIKLIWGKEWDRLLEKDHKGLLVKRMGEAVDGNYQKYSVSNGDYIRNHFFGTDPTLKDLVRDLSADELRKLRRGGHDLDKVYAAYQAATTHKGQPTVILAKTIKGYGLGESGEGKNITHQQKKLNEDELREFRTRFGIPISDEDVATAPFYKPPENSPELKYLKEKRASLGGSVPKRVHHVEPIRTPDEKNFEEFYTGSGDRTVSTTMAFVRILSKLLRDPELGKFVVPIVPDEARTFGMEALFRQCGIYSHVGQLYEPVDADSLLYYKESRDGQILEEGITEAGSISSFIAAGTAYASHGVAMIPFFIYYSMFGLQRVGDLVWAAADMRCRGFLVGGTAGRTTLAGEGLQHQDGHSHLLAYPVPSLVAYDPAFAYELAIIIRDGIHRMYEKHEDIFYYLTVGNENYAMPELPKGPNVKEGVLRGLYKFSAAPDKNPKLKAHLFGSGAIMNEAIAAGEILKDKYGVASDVWSLTSYKALHEDALETERWNRLHPEGARKTSYFENLTQNETGVFVFASDYVKALPDTLSRFVKQPMTSLGTDGFGRSDDRENLRDFFEVNRRHIAFAALSLLNQDGKMTTATLKQAAKDLQIDPERISPLMNM